MLNNSSQHRVIVDPEEMHGYIYTYLRGLQQGPVSLANGPRKVVKVRRSEPVLKYLDWGTK